MRSMISASFRSWRARAADSAGVRTARMSVSARSFSNTDRRLASVGCAVNTGCTARASMAAARASGPRVCGDLGHHARPGGPPRPAECAAPGRGGLVRRRWPAGNRWRMREPGLSPWRSADRPESAAPAPSRTVVRSSTSDSRACFVSDRTRSTSANSSGPSWRTRVSPSNEPTRRTSARRSTPWSIRTGSWAPLISGWDSAMTLSAGWVVAEVSVVSAAMAGILPHFYDAHVTRRSLAAVRMEPTTSVRSGSGNEVAGDVGDELDGAG